MIIEMELPFYATIEYEKKKKKIAYFLNKSVFKIDFSEEFQDERYLKAFKEFWLMCLNNRKNRFIHEDKSEKYDIYVERIMYKYFPEIFETENKNAKNDYNEIKTKLKTICGIAYKFIREHDIEDEQVLNSVNIIGDKTNDKKKFIEDFFSVHQITLTGCKLKSNLSEKETEILEFFIHNAYSSPFSEDTSGSVYIIQMKERDSTGVYRFEKEHYSKKDFRQKFENKILSLFNFEHIGEKMKYMEQKSLFTEMFLHMPFYFVSNPDKKEEFFSFLNEFVEEIRKHVKDMKSLSTKNYSEMIDRELDSLKTHTTLENKFVK